MIFQKFIELVKSALSDSDIVLSNNDKEIMHAVTVSSTMQDAINLWKNMYMDNAPWINGDTCTFSLGLPQTICHHLAVTCLDELSLSFESDTSSLKSDYIRDIFETRLRPTLLKNSEYALALGGMIIKPYLNATGICFDYVRQGDFYPIAFDNDVLVDVAFRDKFIAGNKLYTKIERQKFDGATNTVTIVNTAYISEVRCEDATELGKKISLKDVPRWSNLPDEPAVIYNVDRPLFGYFRVPTPNTLDLDTPLGASVFSCATSLIKKCDVQASRLDWEYEGGQMAIDIDSTAITFPETYYGMNHLDSTKNRLYRTLDMGDDTYKAFAPTLRDSQYIDGLNKYLTMIEDKVGISRGTLSDVQDTTAKTATELNITRQKTAVTIHSIQDSMTTCLNDLFYAVDVFSKLYKSVTNMPVGECTSIFTFGDSVLVDKEAELKHMLLLKNEGIISDVEVRMWWTEEDEETAKERISEIKEDIGGNMLTDIFNDVNNTPKELTNEEEDENNE